jgi:cobalt transporter subunit CbtA
MPVFRSIVFSAVLAGLIVGAFISVVQFFGIVPLIQQSEVYERKAAAPAAAPTAHNHADKKGSESEWEPEPGFQRHAFTFAANILTAIGFALLLTGIYAVRRRTVPWREGMFWGLAGFAVFTVAPSLGLPPELPGMPVADLAARQIWWIGTAGATAIALWLWFFRSEAWAAVLGLALIALPHLIGAPVAPEFHSDVPAALSHRFVVVVTITSLVFWVFLGVCSSVTFGRMGRALMTTELRQR